MLMDKVARRIKEERVQRGWTQGQLAKLIGISQAEISRIENSLTEITLSDIDKFSTVFGVSSIYLMKEEL